MFYRAVSAVNQARNNLNYQQQKFNNAWNSLENRKRSCPSSCRKRRSCLNCGTNIKSWYNFKVYVPDCGPYNRYRCK